MPKQTNKNRKLLLFIGDATLILASAYAAFAIRFGMFGHVLEHRTGATLIILATYAFSLVVLDAYNHALKYRSSAYLAHFLFTIAIATMIVVIIFYLVPVWRFGRGILLINVVILSVLVYVWRLLFDKFFRLTGNPKNIVILGAGAAGITISDMLQSRKDEYKIIGFIDDNVNLLNKTVGLYNVIGTSQDLVAIAENRSADIAVVAITNEHHPQMLKAIIDAKLKGIDIYAMPDLYESISGKLPVNHIGDNWMAYASFKGVRKSLYTLYGKRFFDIALSFVGLVLSSPISLLAWIAVKLDSKGNVIYSQIRVGINEKKFRIYKFRSMREDSEHEGTAVWARENDSRITRVGKILRTTRIDEIPQMLNVLKGDMSFIGPRPERPEFVEQLKEDIPFYSFRHSVKPGITGWAQVNYRYGASTQDSLEKLQYDLFYIKNLSAVMDMHIILKTIHVVLFRKGAR